MEARASFNSAKRRESSVELSFSFFWPAETRLPDSLVGERGKSSESKRNPIVDQDLGKLFAHGLAFAPFPANWDSLPAEFFFCGKCRRSRSPRRQPLLLVALAISQTCHSGDSAASPRKHGANGCLHLPFQARGKCLAADWPWIHSRWLTQGRWIPRNESGPNRSQRAN